MAASDTEDTERDMEWVVGRLKQIQTGYPQVLQDVQQEGESVRLSFYLEDISMDALSSLRAAGVDAWEGRKHLRHLHIALSSMLPKDRGEQILQEFGRFLEKTASGMLVLSDEETLRGQKGGDERSRN